MSIQRAVVNCRECYSLEKFSRNTVEHRHYIQQARNEAMKALENSGYVTHSCTVSTLLDACMNCDYSSPKIAEMLAPKKEAGGAK